VRATQACLIGAETMMLPSKSNSKNKEKLPISSHPSKKKARDLPLNRARPKAQHW